MASFTCTFTGLLLEPSRAPPDATGLKGYNIYQSTILLQGSEIPVNIAHMMLQARKAHGSIARMTANANWHGSALLLVTNRLVGAPVQPIAAVDAKFSHKLPRFVFSGVVTSDYELHDASTQSISFDVTVKRHQVFPFGSVTFRCRTNRDGKRFSLNEYPARGMSLNISGILGGWSRYNTPLVDVHTLRFSYGGELCRVHATDTRNPFERADWEDGYALFELLASMGPTFDIISYNARPTRATCRQYAVTVDPRLARAAVESCPTPNVSRASSAEPTDDEDPIDEPAAAPASPASDDAAVPGDVSRAPSAEPTDVDDVPIGEPTAPPAPTASNAVPASAPASSIVDTAAPRDVGAAASDTEPMIAVTQAELAALVSGWQPGDSAPRRSLQQSSAVIARLLADLSKPRSLHVEAEETNVADVSANPGEPVDSAAVSALLSLGRGSPPSPPAPATQTSLLQPIPVVPGDSVSRGAPVHDASTRAASERRGAPGDRDFVSVQDVRDAFEQSRARLRNKRTQAAEAEDPVRVRKVILRVREQDSWRVFTDNFSSLYTMFIGCDGLFLVLFSTYDPDMTVTGRGGKRLKTYTCTGRLAGKPRNDAAVTLSYRLSGPPLPFGTLIRLTGTFVYEAPTIQVGATKMEVVAHLGNDVDFRCTITLCLEGFVNGPIDFEEVADATNSVDNNARTTLMTFTCTVHGPVPSTVRCFLQKFELRKTLLPVIYEQHKVSIIGTACGHKDDIPFVDILSFAFCVYPPHITKNAEVLYCPDDGGELETELVGIAFPSYNGRAQPAPDSAIAAVATTGVQSSTSSPQQSATSLPTPTPASGTPTPGPATPTPAPAPPTPSSRLGVNETPAVVDAMPTTPVADNVGSPVVDDVTSTPASPAKRMRLTPADVGAPNVTFSSMLSTTPSQPGQAAPFSDVGSAQALGSPFTYEAGLPQGYEHPPQSVHATDAHYMQAAIPEGSAYGSPMSLSIAGSPFQLDEFEETSIGSFAAQDYNVFNFLDTSMIQTLPEDLVTGKWPLYEPFAPALAPEADVAPGSSPVAVVQAPLHDINAPVNAAQAVHRSPSSATVGAASTIDSQAVASSTPAPQVAFAQAQWAGESATIDPRKIFEVRSGYVGP
ncbi:hypothetical protein AURDEDRAFT_165570 [Auricularia subglabra TFB-10046 SS5]|nr:hypothetical protein AURDEDRAFT_165570 [Auricularia subglabra TFB-10046 SS5]